MNKTPLKIILFYMCIFNESGDVTGTHSSLDTMKLSLNLTDDTLKPQLASSNLNDPNCFL